VPACHQEQPPVALEEKAAGIGERPLLLESQEARGGQKQGFNHRDCGGGGTIEELAVEAAADILTLEIRRCR